MTIEPREANSELLDRLDEQQQSRLTELLDEYLQCLERGDRADPSELTADDPELRTVFARYVAKLNAIHGLAGEVSSDKHSDLESLKQNGVCRLGEFEIIQEIGRGGMGTVYEARQPSLNRRVALKLLPMSATFDSRQVARFKNEANAAGQLHHPNIVPIYGVGSAQRIHYYSMQLIDGISIDQWIAQQSTDDRANWQQPVRWAVEIAGALQCAHESGIVHRDVKPSNLMIDGSDRIWITDFGLARCQTNIALTQSGDMIGTLRYMSPEQAAGKPQAVDYRTDIYSLAASLYEMLTLRPAIQGDDRSAVLTQLDRDEPARLKDVRFDLPADLSVVLQKAMAKFKDDRYESADQFAADLQCVLDAKPTLARPPSIATKAKRLAIRHRNAVAVTAGMAAAMFVVLAISSVVILRQNQDILGHQSRADRNFQRARTTVDQLGSTVAGRLAAIPGTEQVRRSLLEDSLSYYQQFIAEAGDDTTLLKEIAATHTKIGCLVAQLESQSKAIEHFRRAADAFDRLPGVVSNDVAVYRLIAANGNYLGLALANTDDVDESMLAYQNAVELQERVIKASDSADDIIHLAKIQNNLGLLFRQNGRFDDSRELFVKSIGLLENLDQSDAQSQAIAAALSNLSSLTLESNPPESVRLLESAIAQRLESTDENSNRLVTSAEVGMMYSNLGSAQLRSNDLVRASDSFQSATRLQRQLCSIAPNVLSHRRDLAMSLNNLGMVFQNQSKIVESIEALAEAVEYQRSITKDQFNIEDETRLGAMEHNYAVALTAIREDDQASKLFQKAIARQKNVLVRQPNAKQSATYLRQHYLALLKTQVKRGQWTNTRKTEAALREMATGDPQTLHEIEAQIRSTRKNQTRNQKSSIVMVRP